MEYLLLIIGFILLIKGADILVTGASSIAKNYGISPLVIGLTIVAFGSSAPELVINLISGYQGNTALAISNIIGSNISNILLILGTTALIYPIKLPISTIKKEIPFLIFADAILILLLISDGVITRFDAGILTILFAAFLAYTFKIAKNKSTDDEEITLLPTWKSIVFVIGGLAGLIIGGKFIVNSAISIALSNGLTEAFIGVTVVAIGTSLPELAISVMAALKKQTDMAIGAIVGSNIFNTLWILGATGLLSPLAGYQGMKFDLGVNLVASMLLFIFAFTFKRQLLDRKEGALLLFIYIGYIGYLIYNI